MSPDIIIRNAGIGDIADINRLLIHLAESLGEPDAYQGDTDALLRHGFGPDPIYRAQVAQVACKPELKSPDTDVGSNSYLAGLCLYFAEFSTWRCRPGIYIQDLIVESNWRGMGIGRGLLEYAHEDAVKHWDVNYLRLAVHRQNHDAQAFYAALGFTADTDNQIMMLDSAAFKQEAFRASQTIHVSKIK
ncbi:MAG: N-acetyltransferase [marine bacterium B5-7]|nr:MAG: N-acetyltransferase [marine bacterium B5-7]